VKKFKSENVKKFLILPVFGFSEQLTAFTEKGLFIRQK